ncbi:unnamed protein product [Prorocentrum cordatum]|uniref:Uncharacterized protein n=1 Tax=Prorocentrum cordatum TaxID=2364126 RepID=A0ABN9VEZ6_9DINO|nr:unnamed protein product [Polarella glacialis]CAK0900278.1 unnamed protein product [Polarella glacialis]
MPAGSGTWRPRSEVEQSSRRLSQTAERWGCGDSLQRRQRALAAQLDAGAAPGPSQPKAEGGAPRDQLDEPEGDEGYLAGRRVKPQTLRRHQEAMQGFTAACPRAAGHGCALEEFDAMLEQYLAIQFFSIGARAHEARDVLCGCAWMRRASVAKLPAALSAVEGFRKEGPGSSRDPCPWEAVVAIAAHLMIHDSSLGPWAAAAVLLGLDTYARIGALRAVKAHDLLKPARGVQPARWAPAFSPEPDGEVSKTKTQDDAVLVGEAAAERQWLNRLMVPLVQGLAPEQRALPFGAHKPCASFETAADAIGLGQFKFVPHMLRHGGPSLDALRGVSLPEIQKRSQWAAPRSALRYSKHGRYMRILQSLPRHIRDQHTAKEELLRSQLSSELRSTR